MDQTVTDRQLQGDGRAWSGPTPASEGEPDIPGVSTIGPPGDPPNPRPPDLGPRSGRSKRTIAALTAAAALVAGGYGIRAVTVPGTEATRNSTTPASATSTSNADGAGDVSSLVQQAQQSVVRIASRVTQLGPFGQTVTGEAVGTGFVVSSDGLILTNAHVVEGGSEVTVTMADGTTHRATVVEVDPPADLAVLDIDVTDLPNLSLGDSSDVLAGQSVVAIGFALGLEGSPTVTTGIVSSIARTIQVADGRVIRTYRDVFQISAAINSGNSGGPLLDLQGRVIGINTAGAQGADNIGFAIPIHQAKALLASAR